MSSKNLFYGSDYDFSNAEEKAYCREELIYNVTEDLLVILEDMDVSKKELSRRLGKSRSYVTQVLSGSRNMTLGSFSDICFALGFKPEIRLPVKEEVQEKPELVDVYKHSEWIVDSFVDITNSGVIRKTSNVIDRQDQKHWAKVA